MRGLGVSSHYTKILKPHLDEICGDTKYDLKNSMDDGVIVHTDRIEDEKFSLVNEIVDENRGNGKINTYNHHIEISWRDINRFVEFVDRNALLASLPNGSLGEFLTSDGWWIYPIPNLVHNTYEFFNQGVFPTVRAKVTHVDVDGGFFGNYGGYWVNCAYVLNYATRLEYVKLTNCRPIYMLGWFADCTSLRHVEIDYSNMSRRLGGCFYRCQLDKESVLLNNLPQCSLTYEPDKAFDLGIHIDHQNDEEVLATISNIEAKGWVLTVQWNGTPTNTASTFGFGQLIYAKVGEHELPNGTTEKYLNWGHYVTDSTGYETFRSLESAYEYFNLEMPISEI